MGELAAPEIPSSVSLTNPRPILEQFTGQLAAVAEKVKGLVIKSDGDAEDMAQLGAQAKSFRDSLETQRKAIVEPLKKHTTAIDRMFKGPKDASQIVIDTAAQKVGAHWTKKQAAAQAEADAENKRLEANYKRQANRAETAGKAAPPPPAKTEAAVSKAVGGAQIRLVWTYVVVDKHLIPEEYLEVKDGAIKRALADGKVIPGINASKKPSTSF